MVERLHLQELERSRKVVRAPLLRAAGARRRRARRREEGDRRREGRQREDQAPLRLRGEEHALRGDIELGIHGWKPFKASEVHRRRYGDCKDKATLLAALLRDNGIDATITLVRTSDRGVLPPDHATMWAFNHAITYVPSQDLFLDGTAGVSGSRELPYPDQGAMAAHRLPRTARRASPRSPRAKPTTTSTAPNTPRSSPRKDSSRSTARSASSARARRPCARRMEEAEQRQERLERQLNQVFNGVHIGELEFSDMSNLEVPVEYKYGAEIERYGVEENGKYIIPLTLFQHQVATAYGQLATRKYDLYSNHPWSTRNVIHYQLPKGTALESLPEGGAPRYAVHVAGAGGARDPRRLRDR